MSGDTIAAISTAPGAGGIAIVRLSGPRAEQLLRAVFRPASEKADMSGRRLTYGAAVDGRGEVLDEVMAVLLHAPRTYTREDMAEIHCHGGGACASAVLARFLALGARAAEPGEFTRRAYENGRIDLSGAEAVMQLIGAQGEAARRAALRQMRGGVTGFVTGAVEKLTELLSRIQAAVDFPEEVDEAVVGAEARVELEALAGELAKRADPRRARMLREGASVVLCGRPNVGKSSLMNALLSAERAIVTDIPGTTRDVLSERMVLDGKVVRLSDTAGIRESEDAIERMGVARAQGEVEAADVALLVLDASQPLAAEDAALLKQVDERYIVCLNKGDLPAVLTAADVEAFLAGSAGKEGQGNDRAGVSACCAGLGDGVVKDGTTGQGDSCEAGSAGAGVAALGVVEEGGTAGQSVACAGEGVRDVLQGAACAGACVDVVKGGTAGQEAACEGVSASCSDEDVRKVVQSVVCAGLGGGVTSPGAVYAEAGDGAVKDGTAGQGVACAGVSSSRAGESVTDVVQSAACAGLRGGVISPGAVCAGAGDGAVKDGTAGQGVACAGVSASCVGESVTDVVQGAACAGLRGGVISPGAVCAGAGDGAVKDGTAGQGVACAGVSASCVGESVTDVVQGDACAGADAFPASGEQSAGEAGRSCALAAGGRSVPVVSLCAATGEGVAELLLRLRERLDAAAGEEECFTVDRQLHLAREAADLLRNCAQALQEGFSPDVVAPDILKACALLDSVTGRDASEAVIDAIFANFCVGK